MGLVATIELDSGLVVENAYIRVDSLKGGKAEMLITASVFASEQSAREGRPALQALYDHLYPRLTDNDLSLWTQAYAKLKLLPQLSRFHDALSVEKPPALQGRPRPDWLQNDRLGLSE